jgi:hypothetical protein
MEHPMEIQGQPPSRNRKKKKNHPNYGRKSMSCNQSSSYEHHFAFMATFVDANEHDDDEDDRKSPVYPTPYPMETPLPRESAFYISEMERKLCEDNAKLQAFLRRIAESIEDRVPEVARSLEKVNIFDVFGDSPDLPSTSSHPDIMGTVPEEPGEETGNISVTRTRTYDSTGVSLDGALFAESQHQPIDGVQSSTVADPAITASFKFNNDRAQNQNQPTILNLKRDNQSGPEKFETSVNGLKISNSLATSDDTSQKLLFLASALRKAKS